MVERRASPHFMDNRSAGGFFPAMTESIRKERPVLERIQKLFRREVVQKPIIQEQVVAETIEVREIPVERHITHPVQEIRVQGNTEYEELGREQAELERQMFFERIREQDRLRKVEVSESEQRIQVNEAPTISRNQVVTKRVINLPIVTEIHYQPVREYYEQHLVRVRYERPIVNIVREEPYFDQAHHLTQPVFMPGQQQMGMGRMATHGYPSTGFHQPSTGVHIPQGTHATGTNGQSYYIPPPPGPPPPVNQMKAKNKVFPVKSFDQTSTSHPYGTKDTTYIPPPPGPPPPVKRMSYKAEKARLKTKVHPVRSYDQTSPSSSPGYPEDPEFRKVREGAVGSANNDVVLDIEPSGTSYDRNIGTAGVSSDDTSKGLMGQMTPISTNVAPDTFKAKSYDQAPDDSVDKLDTLKKFASQRPPADSVDIHKAASYEQTL